MTKSRNFLRCRSANAPTCSRRGPALAAHAENRDCPRCPGNSLSASLDVENLPNSTARELTEPPGHAAPRSPLSARVRVSVKLPEVLCMGYRTRLPPPEDHRSRYPANPSLDRAARARPRLPVHARLSRRVAFCGKPWRRCCSTTPSLPPQGQNAPRQSPAPRRPTLPRPRRRPNVLPMVNVS